MRKDFSNSMAGVSSTDFIRSAYDIKSALSDLNEMDIGQYTKNVALVATATKASMQEMTNAFTLGSGVYKQIGETDIAFSQRFGAVISASVQKFKTTGSDIAQGIATLGKSATALEVSLAEQMAVLGVSKESFNSMSEASTSYRAFLDNVSKANKKMGGSFIDTATGKMKPFVEILQQIKDGTKDMGSAELKKFLMDSFGSVEAVKIIQNNLDNIDKIKRSTQELTNVQSEGLKLTKEMAGSIQQGREFELLSQQIHNASASIGKLFVPIVLKLASTIGSMAKGIQNFSAQHPRLAKVIALTVGALTGLALSLGFVSFAMWAVSAPLLAFIGVIGLVIGAIAGIYVYFDDIKAYFSGFVADWNSGLNQC